MINESLTYIMSVFSIYLSNEQHTPLYLQCVIRFNVLRLNFSCTRAEKERLMENVSSAKTLRLAILCYAKLQFF